MLYPQNNATRQVLSLDGLWRFRLDPMADAAGADWGVAGVPAEGACVMAVPASYNDQSAEARVRDHVGYAWYERAFTVPADWAGKALALRFDSVTHHAKVWLNGEPVLEHAGGYLPFGGDVTARIRCGRPNRLTVRVDNRLSWETIPPGEVVMETDSDGNAYPIQQYHFDFFNYAGIDRPVRLVATHPVHIETLRVEPAELGGAWRVDYAMTIAGAPAAVEVSLLDPDGEPVGAAAGPEGSIRVPAPQLWQPGAPRLYTLVARLRDARGGLLDEYALETGLRTVEVLPDAFLINGAPFYFTGFGKHEDFHIHGKGLDLPLLVKDFELLKWIGANSVRTTHYPYSEEFLQMADRAGIVVIGECPAVGQNTFRGADPVFVEGRINGRSLAQHKRALTEMIERDRHHPCIVMWSLGNEPASGDPGAEAYFAEVTRHARALDASRPLTIVETVWWNATRVAKFCDVICINRYFGWYLQTGHLPLIQKELKKDLEAWHRAYHKPVLVAEYGADTLAGLHQHPPVMFSEEFQEEFLRLYHEVFDQCPWVVGEHVWNFADFATKQGTTRVGGNRKGIFTRDRQPKAAARLLRERWLRKAAESAVDGRGAPAAGSAVHGRGAPAFESAVHGRGPGPGDPAGLRA